MSTLSSLGDLDHFIHRVVQDAMDEATAQYWERRLRSLESALSKPGDYRGAASFEEIQKRDAALSTDIDNVRRHISLLRGQAC